MITLQYALAEMTEQEISTLRKFVAEIRDELNAEALRRNPSLYRPFAAGEDCDLGIAEPIKTQTT